MKTNHCLFKIGLSQKYDLYFQMEAVWIFLSVFDCQCNMLVCLLYPESITRDMTYDKWSMAENLVLKG